MYDHLVENYYGATPKIPEVNPKFLLEAVKLYGVKEDPKLPTECGIEVELEKVKGYHGMFWKQEKDGSLKDKGAEFITFPLKSELVPYALAEYVDILKHNNQSVFSHRCSIHVHINVSKLTVGQLRALLATYLVLENYYFNMVNADRKGNSYCYPLVDARLTWENCQPHKISDHFKYAALNIHHLRDYGTLEFRHHGGTKNPLDLFRWIQVIMQLYSYVNKRTLEEIEEAIMGLNAESNYLEFMVDVMEKNQTLFFGMDHHKMMRNNVTAAKLFLSEL